MYPVIAFGFCLLRTYLRTYLPLMVVNIPHVGFLLPPLFDFTPAPLDLGRLAVGRSDLTGVCEAESVYNGVNVI